MVEQSTPASVRSPVPGLAKLEQAAVEAFGTTVNRSAISLVSSISRSAYFARLEHSEPRTLIVIDRQAFLLGLIEYGLAEPRRHSSSAWLVRWLRDDLGCAPAQLRQIIGDRDQAGRNTAALNRGAQIVLADSLAGLLPGATALAERTVARSVADLRHFLFALLAEPAEEWDVLPTRPTGAQLASLGRQMIAEITRNPESGERVEAWAALLPQDAEAPDEEEGAGAAPIAVEPGETLYLDARALDGMRQRFLARFADFEQLGFDASEGGYWEVERSYKQDLIDAAAAIVGRTDFGPEEVGAGLLHILQSKKSNLLDWREVNRLKEVRAAVPGLIEEKLGELVLSTDAPADSVGRFVAEVGPAYFEGQEGNMPFAHLRTLPTTALALARPAEAIAVRYTTMHRAAVRLTGGSLFKNAPMSAQEYQIVLQIAQHIERVMRDAWGWRPRDLWDVQGFLWVVTEGEEKAVEQPAGSDDRYRTQTDDPARLDALERGPFATVLAARIVEVRNAARGTEEDDDRAFMVHLHGPWGSGKSSMLNLLQHELENPKEPDADGHGDIKVAPAMVVWFNAWKHQRMRPPWWALMNAIYHGALRWCSSSQDERVRFGGRLALWRLWWSWRWKAEVFPILLVVLLVAGLSFALLGFGMGSAIETLSKVGATALVVLAAVYTYARLMIFGSQKAVQAYADLTTDPYRRIVDLFNRLVEKIEAPLVVFIDDLDRCDSDYVVELLEGIQTLFRRAPVVYVVAADRKWICSSFEKKYGDFAGSIGEPCRPLGYLFLDKLFQISAGMPRLTLELQELYLEALLAEGAPAPTAPDPKLVQEALVEMAGKSDEAEIEKVIASRKSVPEQRAARAAGAIQITTAEATTKTENRLKKLSHLLEPNPRSMKRLVNAVAMAQARGILEGRMASPETRARWAMLSLRWPLLADFIADNPEAIAHWRKPKRPAARSKTKPDPAWSEAVQALHGNSAVMAVVGGDGEEGALTAESLTSLLT